MSNVYDLHSAAHATAQDTELAFVAVLDDLCQQADAVQPLSLSLLARIDRIKHAVDAAGTSTSTTLLEG